MRERYPELEKYRAALLAHWQAICAELEEAWARLPAHARDRAASTIAELLDFERGEVLPALAKLLGRSILPPPQSGLEGYCAVRAREVTLTRPLDSAGWSAQVRHPRFGIRTTQWWVEKSLAVAKEALARLGA